MNESIQNWVLHLFLPLSSAVVIVSQNGFFFPILNSCELRATLKWRGSVVQEEKEGFQN
jgi:hypothetical protein